MSTEVEKWIAEIRRLCAEQLDWLDKNEDLAGVDDAKWYDTIASYDEKIAEAGVNLADAIEGKPQVVAPE